MDQRESNRRGEEGEDSNIKIKSPQSAGNISRQPSNENTPEGTDNMKGRDECETRSALKKESGSKMSFSEEDLTNRRYKDKDGRSEARGMVRSLPSGNLLSDIDNIRSLNPSPSPFSAYTFLPSTGGLATPRGVLSPPPIPAVARATEPPIYNPVFMGERAIRSWGGRPSTPQRGNDALVTSSPHEWLASIREDRVVESTPLYDIPQTSVEDIGSEVEGGMAKRERREQDHLMNTLLVEEAASHYYSDGPTPTIAKGRKMNRAVSLMSLTHEGRECSDRSGVPLLNRFQEKVASFDKALWEKEVDGRAGRAIHISMKANKRHTPRTDLIDVDLVRGTAFTKVAPTLYGQQLNHNVLRVILFPFYRDWWGQELTATGYLLLSLLYACHMVSICTYIHSYPNPNMAIVTWDEPIVPFILLLLIGAVYSSVAATRPLKQVSTAGLAKDKRKANKRREEASDWNDGRVKTNHEHSTSESDSDSDSNPFQSGRGEIKVNAILFDTDSLCHKLELTLPHITHFILCKVDETHLTTKFMLVAVLSSLCSAAIPLIYRLHIGGKIKLFLDTGAMDDWSETALGDNWLCTTIIITSFLSHLLLSFSIFFVLVICEQTFFTRFLYAKYFTALTSSRRARAYGLPHFRLHKVINIKMWLALRSFLRRKGPQRSVNTIVSSAFLLVLALLGAIALKATTGSAGLNVSLTDWLILQYAFSLTIYILRFMTLGAHINHKFQNTSLLLTEQINLYLRMEQAPHKKGELGLANNVLGLTSKLLGELEGPYKISGIAMSPMLYNITRVVVVSAFSSVLSDALGFKLKIWKAVKIK